MHRRSAKNAKLRVQMLRMYHLMRLHLSKQEVVLPERVDPPDPLPIGDLPQLKVASWAVHQRQAHS